MLIGQPAEEPLSGARAMLDDGLFKRFPKPDFGFAAHVTNLPAGVVAIKAGPSSSASDSYSIIFHGRGGHGSLPAATLDPLPIAPRSATHTHVMTARDNHPASIG